MVDSANYIYFFNDLLFAIEDLYGGKIPSEIEKKEKELFWNVSLHFKTKMVVPLDSDFVLFNLNQNLFHIKNKNYDLAIILGSKGKSLLNKISSSLHIKNKMLLTIKRYFIDEKLDDLKTEFLLNHEEISELKNFLKEKDDLNILIIDDIIFSGGTIKTAKEMLGITSENFDIITMIAFKDSIENSEDRIYSGIYINDISWPNAETDLWCFRDFIEMDAVPIKNRESTSFLQQKNFSKKFIFGEQYDKVLHMTETFIKEIGLHERNNLWKI